MAFHHGQKCLPFAAPLQGQTPTYRRSTIVRICKRTDFILGFGVGRPCEPVKDICWTRYGSANHRYRNSNFVIFKPYFYFYSHTNYLTVISNEFAFAVSTFRTKRYANFLVIRRHLPAAPRLSKRRPWSRRSSREP